MNEPNETTALPAENGALPRQEAVTPPPAGEIHYPSGMVLPAAGAAPVLRTPYPRRRALGRDLALAGVLLLFCFLFWDSVFWARGIGLGEAIGLFALLPAALLYLRKREGRMTAYGWVCAVLYELCALLQVLSGDNVLKLLAMLALIPLLRIVLLERLGLRTGLGLRNRLHDLFAACVSMSYGRLGAGCWALTHSGSADTNRSRHTKAVLLGLLCAVPALLVLIPLLISSDAAFEGLVNSLDWTLAKKGLAALACGGFMALLLFTLLFSSDRGPRPLSGAPLKGVEPTAVAAFLAAISAAYALYLAAQFAYFTDAFRGLLPKDFTVAEYARRGFFEMNAIVFLNLSLIVLALAFCRKEGGKLPAAVKGLSLFLCLFSIALVATALSKMVLYMGSFGLTRLRVLTSAFMIFLALVVAAVALRLFVKKLPVPQFAVALGCAILIALSLVNVDGLVARYNVDAWKTGRLDSLDMDTICYLGDGAVPVLVELAEDEDSAVAERARSNLKYRDPETDWRSWNLVTQQAIDALEEYHR